MTSAPGIKAISGNRHGIFYGEKIEISLLMLQPVRSISTHTGKQPVSIAGSLLRYWQAPILMRQYGSADIAARNTTSA